MKKNILLTSLLFAGLFLTTNMVQAAPPPPHHGGPHGHMGPKPPMHHSQMHRPPMNHHIHRPPIHNHNLHRVRHYYGFSSPYYYGYHPVSYPISYTIPRLYHPMHHGHFGATFHISL